MWVLDVIKSLKKSKVQFAIAGGYAVALHGAVRATIDLDFVVVWSKDNLNQLEKSLLSMGFKSKQPISAKDVFSFRNEYIEKRSLIAWSFFEEGDPSHIVDIIITEDLKKMSIKTIGAFGEKIPILSMKDLIQMKKKSGRPQDLADVRSLEHLNEKN